MTNQPKTGKRCGCKKGIYRDNCGACEGTGWMIDFKAIRARTQKREEEEDCNLITACVRAYSRGETMAAEWCEPHQRPDWCWYTAAWGVDSEGT